MHKYKKEIFLLIALIILVSYFYFLLVNFDAEYSQIFYVILTILSFVSLFYIFYYAFGFVFIVSFLATWLFLHLVDFTNYLHGYKLYMLFLSIILIGIFLLINIFKKNYIFILGSFLAIMYVFIISVSSFFSINWGPPDPHYFLFFFGPYYD
jgi:hypothetical protein